MSEKIWLSPPHMGGKELGYVNDAFQSNWVAPLGPHVDQFELELAAYCGVSHAAALSSGTAALHLALVELGIGRGDEVLASTFTFSATINPIVYQGATPVLIDSEKQTWNMDPDLLEEAIRDRIRKGKLPKAIIPVHLYGMPANMDRILAIAGEYGIAVVEDAAEALGSRYRGQPAGSFGDMSVLSFNGNKIITTSGGGALLSDSREYVDHIRNLSTQAREDAPHYQHSEIGYNYRMSNILAAIGRGQMEVLDERVRKRREIFDRYRELLSGIEGIRFQEEPGPDYFSNRWLTTILLASSGAPANREALRLGLEKENIDSRPLWKPMHLQPVYSDCPSYLNGVSASLFDRGLCLPSGTGMTDSQFERILETIKKYVRP